MRIPIGIPGLLLALGLVTSAQPPAPTPEHQRLTVVPNDNRTPAGRMRGDTLVLALTVAQARWFLLGEQNPGFDVVAFAEDGKPPTVPGPLIRVRVSTPIRATVRNPLADTIILHAFSERGLPTDSVAVLPGATAEIRFSANRVGNHFYWAVASGARRLLSPALQLGPGLQRPGYDSQLSGAFIVDPPGPIPDDRVFVITELADQDRCGPRPCQERLGLTAREFTAINGRSWPHTERLQYAVGDSVRWRVINMSLQPHPMHLHGFYFRVDAHSSARTGVDTIYSPEQRRMAVTQGIGLGESISMVWSPDRPGGWIFHCHLTTHAVKLPPVDKPDSLNWPSHHHGDPDRHVVEGMNGLILGMTVTGGRAAPDPQPARSLRLFIQSDSAAGDSIRRLGYVLQRGAEPRRDSVEYPGPALVLTRGEPTRIEVVNRSPEPSAVHWHGIELDSYYDGAVGWSGRPGRIAPAIRPGGRFEVMITPPRAGTFMYHTHFNEIRQQFGGLVGALIVLEPGERWDPARDPVFLVSDGPFRRALINGSTAPPAVELKVGTTYRLRFADISVYHPVGVIRLVRDQAFDTWRALAKDGFTLPASQATMRPSFVRISSGETADFEFTPDRPGDLRLEYTLSPNPQAPNVLASVQLRVR